MTSLSSAAHQWLASGKVRGDDKAVSFSIVDVPTGITVTRRTGVAHYVADAAEISRKGETTLAVRAVCGATTVDAEILSEIDEVECHACRLAAALPQGPCVYFAWGDDGLLLYVGSSIKVAQRVRAHQNSTSWWGDVRRLTFREYDSELDARRAEVSSIGERPGLHNRESRRDRSARPLLDGIEIGVEA